MLNNCSSRGNFFNTGGGIKLQVIDIKHKDYIGLVSPDTAFWALVKKGQIEKILTDPSSLKAYRKKEKLFVAEMNKLRYGLIPSAVYFNPTDRCNLDCSYCYIPQRLRKNGRHMSSKRIQEALLILKSYFKNTLPKGQRPEIVFHGAEPMLNRHGIFTAIEKLGDYFRFGIQTNGTLLDDESLRFLTQRKINIGLSLDGHIPKVADRLRKNWSGNGASLKVIEVIKKLRGYPNYSIICTVTEANMHSLKQMVSFLHNLEVPSCLLNALRCTQPASRKSKPKDNEVAKYYLDALEFSYELYKKTQRKLIVANFANILLAIIAPAARRLMCDISPCGGGRCFFAVSANGDLFPCSEFIGIKKFKGGNLFKDNISKVLKTQNFRLVTERKIENIQPCSHCAIRHFCGAPCPAEAHEMNGAIEAPGAFCEFYEEQVRYAFRLISENKENAFLWDDWQKGTSTALEIS